MKRFSLMIAVACLFSGECLAGVMDVLGYRPNDGGGRISLYDSSLGALTNIDGLGTVIDYALNINGDVLAVSDNQGVAGLDRLRRFDSTGAFQGSIDQNIGSITVGANGNILMYRPLDGGGRVSVYDSSLGFVTSLDGLGTVLDMAINANGDILVVSDNQGVAGLDRLRRFDSTGAFQGNVDQNIGSITVGANGNILMYRPLDGGGRVSVYDSSLGFVTSLNGLETVLDMAINTNGDILVISDNAGVAFTDQDRIRRFDSTGTFLGSFDEVFSDLEVNTNGEVLLVRPIAAPLGRVARYESDLTYIDKLDSQGIVSIATAPVPEPATLGLLALGAVMIGLGRKRNHQLR